MTRRAPILIGLTLIASWYGMMLVHELGHVLAARGTGSAVAAVRVPWVGFSQTEMVRYAEPAWVVVAAGPAAGVVLPVLAWLAVRRVGRGRACEPLARFFAGFCLVANGGYMASALVNAAGDAADLAALGVSRWAIAVPGVIAAGLGLAVWNGLGRSFGLGGGDVRRGMTLAAGIAAAGVLGVVAVIGVLGRP